MPKTCNPNRKRGHYARYSAIRKSARGIAVEILSRIDEEKAYSDILLAEALKDTPLSQQDKRLVTMLVYGVLRQRNQVDWFIENVAVQPITDLSSSMKAILRSGVYQLLFLNRIPASAVINEAVNLARGYGHPGSAGFVNAVLRQLQRRLPAIHFPEKELDPIGHISLSFAHPEWMVRRWLERYGIDECIALCKANNQQPQLTIRLNTLKVPAEEAPAYLAADLEELTPSGILPEGFSLAGPRPLMLTSSYRKGYFEIQGLSSMLAARTLDPQPGELILDACAGRGGKTTYLAQLMKNQGLLIALDRLPQKLQSLRRRSHRLGILIAQAVCGDITSEPFKLQFDRILVDAPCSSLGILRRHPEIKWIRKESDLAELHPRQVSILESSSHFVKTNGILVYSTCSFEPEETSHVLEEFLQRNADFRREDIQKFIPASLHSAVEEDGFLRIYPHRHDMDGFFIAVLRRR
ncbi:MAG: 16S rRNA (cytosine(967)-C(5))-methyltransferase RsmB [bacterium]